VEAVDESAADWKRERVSFNAAYANERVPAYLFIPRNASPPYQVIICVPGADMFGGPSFDQFSLYFYDFLIRSGRAVLFPVFHNTYGERRVGFGGGMSGLRDRVIQRAKDFFRSVDYLETRPDIDHNRLGFLGLSFGADNGPRLLALEKRIKAGVLIGGGLDASVKFPPEMDPINFVPRVTLPVLMINGRYDFLNLYKTEQLPLLRWLGTPAKDKRHAVFDAGHLPARNDIIKETLDWLDRYLGPVNQSGHQ